MKQKLLKISIGNLRSQFIFIKVKFLIFWIHRKDNPEFCWSKKEPHLHKIGACQLRWYHRNVCVCFFLRKKEDQSIMEESYELQLMFFSIS